MNFGFIGLGNYSRNHLRAIEKNKKTRLVSAYDVIQSRADEVAKRFSAKKARSIEEVVDDPDVQAVIITTPNAMHFEHFKACVIRGKHVFVNVPVATERTEAEEMLHLVERHKVVFMAGHNLRKNPAILHLKKVLASDEIGTVHFVEATVSGMSGYDLTPDNWRYSKETAPLLPFTQMAVVFIDLVLDVFGAPEKIAAFMSKRDGAGDAPDVGMVIARYEDGRMAYIGCSYVSFSVYEITFVGNRGKVKWGYRNNNSLIVTFPKEQHKIAFDRIDEQHEELVEFMECIEKGQKPSVSGPEVYHVAEYFDCIRRSIETERSVHFKKLQ